MPLSGGRLNSLIKVGLREHVRREIGDSNSFNESHCRGNQKKKKKVELLTRGKLN